MAQVMRSVGKEMKAEYGSGGSGSGIGHVAIDLIKETEGDTEFRLERFLEKPDSQKFYCPNCNACIENINVRRAEPRPIIFAYWSSFLVVIGAPTKKWDILKSIVYGGLLESITSLNIITSAAGADATALNILALGLANLIGGLFVIGHNLMELRNDQSGWYSTGEANEETSRYHQELGLRENFKRHGIVTVLSFLLFGLVAPMTYSFSFLKSDNKDFKLIAAVSTSLVCIIVLATGKTYIQKTSSFYGYVKTILSFVIPGFMASGVSYGIGDLIKKLLEKLGLFKSSTTFTPSFPRTAKLASE